MMRNTKWTADKANEWFENMPWITGCNFSPSTAINQLEMWQKDTFDTGTIKRELGWAAELGFNAMRVYLHDLLWEDDADGFSERINEYLEISSGLGIKTMLVLFDDCWNKEFELGKQPEPKPGVHNSGWLQSPGEKVVLDSSQWGRLEKYVKEVIAKFGNDDRVIVWDLYNEPGNSEMGEKSLPLLKKTFEWAREIDPIQPLTAGTWIDKTPELNEYQLNESDIITFHNYLGADNLRKEIIKLKEHNRPILCTEYMARVNDCFFQTQMPIFKESNVGCFNWGFVSGKTQTVLPWKELVEKSPHGLWFHDILHKDGSPYDQKEVDFIKLITKI